MIADGVRRPTDWSAAEPNGNQRPQCYTNVGASLDISAVISTSSAVLRGRNPRKSALSQRQSAAPIPRRGVEPRTY